jgi:LysR family transcriptional regulator, positive regulator for ilvC
MDTENLKLFLHLADTLHFGKTSKACHMSPSTLSRQIQRIEEEIGQALFERDNRSVTLTENGLKFRRYAKESLEKWYELLQSLNGENQELKGEISMYCSVTASYSVLSDLLSDFRKQHSKIEIKLRTGDAASSIEKVLSGEVDLVIAAKPDMLSPKLDFITIAESPLLFIAPKTDCLVRTMVNGKEIQWDKIPVIIPERGLARKRVDLWFKQKGLKPNIYAQVLGNEGIVSMVNLGFGVGLVPQLVYKNSPFEDKVEILSVSNPLKPYQVGVCATKKRIKNSLIAAFWEVALKREL